MTRYYGCQKFKKVGVREIMKHWAAYYYFFRTKAKIIDGKKIAEEIQNEILQDVTKWTASGHRAPCLVAILVGEDPASQTYVGKKMISAKAVGITSRTLRLPESTTEQELLEKVEDLNNDPEVDAILVQLPVPEHMNERKICNAVDPRKDVDGFHIDNIGKLCLNMKTFVPATALGVIELIKR